MKRTNESNGGWNQEVTDAEGRRRFHGAFTGGYSAGYFNTVGSKEGWQPTTFESSRRKRHGGHVQRPEDFMDADDDPLLGHRLETADKYDTLQTSARQRMAAQPLAGSVQSGSTTGGSIPMFTLPDALVLPADDSIGKALLTRMGWKEGQGIGPRLRRRKLMDENEQEGADNALYAGRRHQDTRKRRRDGDVDEMKDATSSKQVGETNIKASKEDEYVMVPPRTKVDASAFPTPKLDKYGAGFDPYVNAPEFARYKQQQQAGGADAGHKRELVTFAEALSGGSSASGHGSAKRLESGNSRIALGFGLGALEENDDLDVYGTASMRDFDDSIAPVGSASAIKRLDSAARESMTTTTSRHGNDQTRGRSRTLLCSDGRPALPGFQLADKPAKTPKIGVVRLPVPPDFQETHVFPRDDEDEAAVSQVYRKYDFSTEKQGRGSWMTTAQRAQLLSDNPLAPSAKSGPLPLATPPQLPTSASVTSTRSSRWSAPRGSTPSDEAATPSAVVKERQPLVQGVQGEQFRANISASIAKRFVSASSSTENNEVPSSQSEDVNKRKLSHRTESEWAPHSLLCKRFHVKCAGRTISGNGRYNENDDASAMGDLFSSELAPHLLDYANQRVKQQQPQLQQDPDNAVSGGRVPAQGDVVGTKLTLADDIPPLPPLVKPSTDLLKSIFEPSDESEADEEDDVVTDMERHGDGDDENQPQSPIPPIVHDYGTSLSGNIALAAVQPSRSVERKKNSSSLTSSSDSSDSSGEEDEGKRNTRMNLSKEESGAILETRRSGTLHKKTDRKEPRHRSSSSREKKERKKKKKTSKKHKTDSKKRRDRRERDRSRDRSVSQNRKHDRKRRRRYTDE